MVVEEPKVVGGRVVHLGALEALISTVGIVMELPRLLVFWRVGLGLGLVVGLGLGWVVLLPLRAGPPVLEPIVDVGLGDLAVLAELGGNVFNLLLARCPVSLLEDPLQYLKLHRRRSPPLPRRDLVPR